MAMITNARFRVESVRMLPMRCMSTFSPVKKVGVVGLGLMGHGIAQTAAEKGYDVVAIETEQRFLDAGMARIEKSIEKLTVRSVSKGKMTYEQAATSVASTMGRIKPVLDIKALNECDLIVEAVIEDIQLKETLYAAIGKAVSNTCVIASNTSSLSVSKMAEFCGRPKQMCGLHFFNPVQLMQLVEVIKTDQTDPVIFDSAFAFAKALGKTPIECIDTPGFVVNRLLVPYMMSAIELHERGVASVADVDTAMRLGAGHPMGPIQLTDYIGLDTALNIISGWERDYPDDGWTVPTSLREKVADGKLGRKSGEGYYKWDGDKLAA
eukprot:CAMPEP_0119341908 /NCGR_PEP_ID=MMETSP1333-20130426/103589_1 /TAXON_ID=418940 /ORGANISM="Scyphosphaera apsteinii, Strain RCC1455" /LENGTH=322 /DNA_ID=CAMNT_0007354005 /DNA_START=24 /DNA_END=992 /DNA_ORIENTATION=+